MLKGITGNGVEQLNSARRYLSYRHTWISRQFFNSRNKTLALFFGNQTGKNALIAYNYVRRILGTHPIAEKNALYFECENKHTFAPYIVANGAITVCPSCKATLRPHVRECRVYRFISEVQPLPSGITEQADGFQNEGSAEIRNTQYPEFKKWLPPYLLKKDITIRDRSQVITDPFGYGDIIIDYSSYSQTKQSQSGVQRISIWADEQPPEGFLDEQTPRLFAENGDLIITYTPVENITYLYDQVFERAKTFYRTKVICEKYYKKHENKNVAQIETTNSPVDIAVFQAATDDNPIFAGRNIEEMYSLYDDVDRIIMRRFGIFKAISGRIFKSFDPRVHIIDDNKYFAFAA